MIRIAIIAGKLHSGGKKNLIMEYYRNIDHDELQFDFICDNDSNGIPDEEICELGGRVYRITPYEFLFSHLKDLFVILKTNHYQIMHAYDNTLNIFPLFIGWLLGVKIRISESISKGDKREKKSVIKYLLRPFSKFFATDYFSNSIDCGRWQFGDKTFLQGRINVFKTVINAEENGFDFELRKDTRIKYGWEEKIVYGFIGRYVEQKNPLFLIDIFAEINKIQNDAILIMIGFGDLKEKIADKIKSYNLEGKVFDLGRREDIKKFYNAFDAFLLPSLYEGMPVVGIEAQCSGLPVFFSDSITEETTVCENAHYISLSKKPADWADYIIHNVNVKPRRSYINEIIRAGFDSKNESLRLQEFYMSRIRTCIAPFR